MQLSQLEGFVARYYVVTWWLLLIMWTSAEVLVALVCVAFGVLVIAVRSLYRAALAPTRGEAMAFTSATNGGELVARALVANGVRTVYTLCGGHIAPINVYSKKNGIRVVDVRNEATAVFAADATFRMTGVTGVAVVTAGPGVTNSTTALMNALLSQSAMVVLGGATAGFLRGRGALQDVDQFSVVRPCCKWATRVSRICDIGVTMERAFHVANEGKPGPVFVEFPLELLYSRDTLLENLAPMLARAPAVVKWYLNWHVSRVFSCVGKIVHVAALQRPTFARATASAVDKTARMLLGAERPVLVIGSQTLISPDPSRLNEHILDLVRAIETIGVPVFLSGMARGLLGRGHALQMRQKRKEALRQADVVVLSGSVLDFRMDYGNCFGRKTRVVAANRCPAELRLNRTPDLPVLADPSLFLIDLAARLRTLGTPRVPREPWIKTLRDKDDAARAEMARKAASAPVGESGLDPLLVCAALDDAVAASASGGRPAPIIIGDGGDFVGTASYSVEPVAPLSWLDPGPYGTLGCGAGFAIAASLMRPGADVWLLWGDGACGYGLADLDTMAKFGCRVISIVGNNGAWAQVQRDQVRILGDGVACDLPKCSYERVAEAFGGSGVVVREGNQQFIAKHFNDAADLCKSTGKPVLVNVILAQNDFRAGSISV